MANYIVILFKNKKKVKIIKKYVSLQNAKNYITNLIKKSNEVIFDTKFENGISVEYEVGLVDTVSFKKLPTYKIDEFGRQIRVISDDSDYNLIELHSYKKPETIFDLQKKTKIETHVFIKNYLRGKNLKVISVINNKIIVQEDDVFNIFSLKNKDESIRFVECLSKFFFINGRSDCLFITDTSTAQKKYLLNILSENGIDKKILYRGFTTYPRQEE